LAPLDWKRIIYCAKSFIAIHYNQLNFNLIFNRIKFISHTILSVLSNKFINYKRYYFMYAKFQFSLSWIVCYIPPYEIRCRIRMEKNKMQAEISNTIDCGRLCCAYLYFDITRFSTSSQNTWNLQNSRVYVPTSCAVEDWTTGIPGYIPVGRNSYKICTINSIV